MSTKTPAPKRARKKQQLITERVLARHNFTTAELADLGQQSGRIDNEIGILQRDLADMAKEMKAKIEIKVTTRTAISQKLSNGYEMREVTARVIYDTKKRLKRFVNPKDKKEIYREEQMTDADWQLPMFRREEILSRKPAGANALEKPPGKTPAGKTNVGAKLDEAIEEAAQTHTKVDLDLDAAISDAVIPEKLIKKFGQVAKKAGWPAKIVKPIQQYADTYSDKGIGEVADRLRPFCIAK